jgi:membrane-associated protease RseP (regulator of RpoE activity)
MKWQGWTQRLQKISLALAGALALPAASQAQLFAPAEAEVAENLPPTITLVAEHLDQLRGMKPSSHWIGVVVRPCDEVIRKHLKLEGGLVVDEVTPDSPAAKAGIEKHDILLTLNDASVADLKSLMDFLSENKEKVIVVKLLHDGAARTVEVAPAERPQDQFKFFPEGGFSFQLPEGGVPKEIELWMKEFAKDPERARAWRFEGEPFRARFFHPGVLLGEEEKVELEAAQGKLPENLQITVKKQGDKPAKITVQRGDEKWEVTDEQLDKLPDDVRAHVETFLGPANHLGIRIDGPKWTVPLEGAGPRVRILAAPRVAQPARVEAHAIRVAGPDLEKKLDEINSRLEKIEKALQKLSEK